MAMGIFLLVVSFTFLAAPTLLDPLLTTVNDDKIEQSDRIATIMVTEFAEPGASVTVSESEMSAFFSGTNDSDELREFVGLQSDYGVNVTVVNGTHPMHTVGDPYTGQPGAVKTVRIISIANQTCDPTCRMVVRIW